MIEILLFSILGLAGTAIGGALAGIADDETDPDDGHAETGADETADDSAVTGPDLLRAAADADVADSSRQSGPHGGSVTGDHSNPVAGGSGGETLDGGADDDTLVGGDGDDALTDWAGSNTMSGGAGDDTLTGGMDAGALSSISGGDGDDTITDYDADAHIDGGAGDDTIATGHGRSVVAAGDGNDTVATGIGTDTVFGGAGDDTLSVIGTQTAGETDVVHGGAGDDVLHLRGSADAWGDDGSDTFAAYANTWVKDAPVVRDFNPDEDRLEIEIDSHEGWQTLDDFHVTVEDFADGTGASIFVDGIEVMKVPGAAGLKVGELVLTLV